MALKKSEQTIFDVINNAFSGMIAAKMDVNQVKDILGAQILSFENATKFKIKIVLNGDEGHLEVIDLSKDFLRIRNPNQDTKVLRTKIEGVGIEVKLFKKDDFEFSNVDVVNALKSLTEKVEKMDMVLSKQDVSDIDIMSLSAGACSESSLEESEEAEDNVLVELSDEDISEDSGVLTELEEPEVFNEEEDFGVLTELEEPEIFNEEEEEDSDLDKFIG